ncbi:MAG: aldehyde dehydrogenase family protein, partial [Actinomycetota bacterium]|nr:aldehyde dehydrogenase family protein [Actinomycetota bacterium]
EEIFGPVVSLITWSDYDEMVRVANDVEYGLTANIWTRDVSLAHRTAAAIEAGMVWINGSGRKPVGTPFGGYGHSGLGKEGSLDELIGYTRGKTVVTVLDTI